MPAERARAPPAGPAQRTAQGREIPSPWPFSLDTARRRAAWCEPVSTTRPMRICNAHQERARWLEERRRGLGGSDAPAILGLSPFATPYSVAAQKLGLEAEDAETELQRWGRFVERPMIDAFVEETGWPAALSGDLFRSAEIDWMQVTLDGTVERAGETGGVECKLKIYHAREWEVSGVPEHVVAQCQHAMKVMDFRFMVVLVLLDGYRLRWKVVERDETLIQRLVAEEQDFWRRLADGRPIPVRGPGEVNARALKALYPEDEGTIVDLAGAEWIARVDAWREASDQENRWKRLKEERRDEIVAAMARATFARLEGGRTLSLKTTRRAAYPVKASSFRVLREVKLG